MGANLLKIGICVCVEINSVDLRESVSPAGIAFDESTFEISVSTVRMNITIETLRTVEE